MTDGRPGTEWKKAKMEKSKLLFHYQTIHIEMGDDTQAKQGFQMFKWKSGKDVGSFPRQQTDLPSPHTPKARAERITNTSKLFNIFSVSVRQCVSVVYVSRLLSLVLICLP